MGKKKKEEDRMLPLIKQLPKIVFKKEGSNVKRIS